MKSCFAPWRASIRTNRIRCVLKLVGASDFVVYQHEEVATRFDIAPERRTLCLPKQEH